MNFAIVCIIALICLGVIAGIVSYFDTGEDTITTGHDCSTCTAADEGSCKIHCLLEEKKNQKGKDEE